MEINFLFYSKTRILCERLSTSCYRVLWPDMALNEDLRGPVTCRRVDEKAEGAINGIRKGQTLLATLCNEIHYPKIVDVWVAPETHDAEQWRGSTSFSGSPRGSWDIFHQTVNNGRQEWLPSYALYSGKWQP